MAVGRPGREGPFPSTRAGRGVQRSGPVGTPWQDRPLGFDLFVFRRVWLS